MTKKPAKQETMDVPATTGQKHVDGRSKTWFRPGESGNPNGRPAGSKNRVNEDFLGALADDFAQHGAGAIKEMREKDPGGYVRVVAALVPTESKHEVTGNEAFVRIWQAVASGTLASLIEQFEDDAEARH